MMLFRESISKQSAASRKIFIFYFILMTPTREFVFLLLHRRHFAFSLFSKLFTI